MARATTKMLAFPSANLQVKPENLKKLLINRFFAALLILLSCRLQSIVSLLQCCRCMLLSVCHAGATQNVSFKALQRENKQTPGSST